MTEPQNQSVDQPATTTKEPETVEESPDVAAAPPVSKWPWGVSAAIALVVLGALGFAILQGWQFVTDNSERQEKQDYEQLLNLIDRVESVALFVLGAVFGVAASGATAVGAATAAKKNKEEAVKQHKLARENERAARQNRAVAKTAISDALATTEVLDRYVEQLRDDIDLPRVSAEPELTQVEVSPDLADRMREVVLRGDLDQSLGVSYVVPADSLTEAAVTAEDLRSAEQLIDDVRARWAT